MLSPVRTTNRNPIREKALCVLPHLGEFTLQAVREAWEHGVAAAQDDVPVQVAYDIHIRGYDRVKDQLRGITLLLQKKTKYGADRGEVTYLCDAFAIEAEHRGLEERLSTPEPLVADCDHLYSG
jgi:hypothetical protein